MNTEESGLVAYARAELEFLCDGDEMNEEMANGVLEIVRAFAEQGHSGFSASYALSLLKKLLAYEPIGPLTGESGEWVEVATGVFQNRRCSRVFKQDDRFNGRAYDIDGIVWEDSDGTRCTNADSRVPVTFPYTPTTEYRQRPAP